MLLNIFGNLFRWLFSEYAPLKYAFGGENYSLLIDTIGGYCLAVSFISMGLVFIWVANKNANKPLHKERKFLTQLLGLAIFFDGIARFLTELSIYNNYLHIHVIVKLIGGILGIISLLYTPLLLRKMREARTFDEISATMEETKEKLNQIHELNRRLDGNGT